MKTFPRTLRHRLRGAALMALAPMLFLAVACAQLSGEEPAPPLTPKATPPPTLVVPDALRWGFNPLRPTGQADPSTEYSPLPPGYRLETAATGLDKPTQLVATPDGRLLIAEQAGAVRVVENGLLLDEPFAVIDVFLPEHIGELGLVGIAIDPEFEQNRYVYVSYHADNPRRTAIARLRDEGGRGADIEEIFAWEAAPECCHIGGGMAFAPDGTLLMGLGDHALLVGTDDRWDAETAQDPSTPPGSVLRLNRDGSFPDDNPFDGPVYAYGLRNPYGIAVDPDTGRIFAAENGVYGQDALVEIKPGANYGWPGRALRVPQSEIEPPLAFYHERFGIAGLEFYSSDVLSEFRGRLFACQFHLGGALHEYEFNDDGSVARDTIRATGCTTDVTTGADGFLYFLNYSEGVLYRISANL